jgi:hypothetical protein
MLLFMRLYLPLSCFACETITWVYLALNENDHLLIN